LKIEHPKTVYIGLGTNLGDREAYIKYAMQALSDLSATDMLCSATYTSKAHVLDENEHPPYLNAVCKIETHLSPFELLEKLQTIEANAGRIRVEKWGNRELDLDILYYENWILSTQTLQIPHPRILDRRFVLQPLYEIAPHLKLPSPNISLKEALDNCTDNEIMCFA
jgi:2-amino-4-hydroxy-6-hydroxymethyldihydropteridine diphosphokinase